jgi:hypothetical protein
LRKAVNHTWSSPFQKYIFLGQNLLLPLPVISIRKGKGFQWAVVDGVERKLLGLKCIMEEGYMEFSIS